MRAPVELSKRFGDWPVFTIDDAFLFLGGKRKVSKKTVQVTLSRMVKDGRLYHVSKGKFSFTKTAETAGFAYSPFYYGGLSALMIRDLIDDQVKMEVMTTKTVRHRRAVAFGDIELVVHHLPKAYYFGFNEIRYLNHTVPVSDPEKTFIDLLYFRVTPSSYDYYALVNAIDKKKLASYLKRYKNGFAKKAKRFFDSMVKSARQRRA